jgi:hypothetical protein
LNERKAYFSLRLILAGPAVLDDQQQGTSIAACYFPAAWILSSEVR